MEYVIETKGLTKSFSSKLAVDHIDIHIKRGDIYGFIGRNGAGKTTAMKLVLGLLKPSDGEITLFGNKDLNKQRLRIGSLIEAPGLYKNATAYENMKRFSIIYGGAEEEIRENLELVGLADTGKKKAGAFSLGMKQRLGIAIALLGKPEVLVLDEPVNGLDPAGIKEIRDTILKLNKEKGVTFFISSHLLDELAKITTVYGIINNGVLVEEIEAEALLERCRQNLRIRVNEVGRALHLIREHYEIGRFETKDDTIVLYDHYDHPDEINALLVQNGIKVYELAASELGFEDYFIERIGH